MNSAIENFRLLRRYTVSAPVDVPTQEIIPEQAETLEDVDRAAKSGALKLTIPRGVDPGIWQRTYETVLAETGDEMMAWLAALGQVRRGQYGMATKSRKDGASVFVDGWSNMFGDPRISDTDRQYYAPDTMFLLEYYPRAPLWYEHGDDSIYGSYPIGWRVAWKVYGYGIWLVHELDQKHPQFNRTLGELDDGLLTYSSDSIWHYVKRGLKPDGKLANWALAGCSLVKHPAELGLGVAVPRIEEPAETETPEAAANPES